jgi:hypothetical protein
MTHCLTQGENMDEQWKTIMRWPDYMVSNFGSVYTNKRNRLLKMSINDHGYYKVSLCRDKEWRSIGVHILVATEFVDGWFEGAVVNHKDGIKTNNNDTNLEWVTPRENVLHAIALGLRNKPKLKPPIIIQPGQRTAYLKSLRKEK